MELRLGIDVGSTTVKLVLLDENDSIVYSKYERHMSNVFEKAGELLQELLKENYDLGFITLPKKYDETALEDARRARHREQRCLSGINMF